MAYRTHSLSRYRKAQFFILSAFAIVTILYYVSQWIAPYTIIDTSSVVMMEEPYIFNNIVEKTDQAVSGSKTFEELIYNLEEYKIFASDYCTAKGYELTFNYVKTPADHPGIFFSCIRLKSPNMVLENSHVVTE